MLSATFVRTSVKLEKQSDILVDTPSHQLQINKEQVSLMSGDTWRHNDD